MAKEDLIFSRKEFLNLDGINNMANIVTYIKRSCWNQAHKEDLENRDLEINFTIADCERKISLDIELETEEDRENALYKVDTLISVLQDFRLAIIKESAIQKTRQELLRNKRLEAEKQRAMEQ